MPLEAAKAMYKEVKVIYKAVRAIHKAVKAIYKAVKASTSFRAHRAFPTHPVASCEEREYLLSVCRRTVNSRRPERARNEGWRGPCEHGTCKAVTARFWP
jgi:hypothetical protein